MENSASPSAEPDVKPPSRHAIYFVLITVLLDMIGFGLIIPVLPVLIKTVGHMTLAEACWLAAGCSLPIRRRSSFSAR